MIPQPIFIQDVFKPIVASVSAKLLASLQDYDDMITGVHYLFGHPLEVVNTITQYDQGDSSKFNKYPLVALFLDTKEKMAPQVGVYASYRLHMAIIRACYDPNQTADQRDETNFKPVLMPIYLQLMEEIRLSGGFMTVGSQIPHDKTNRYYWGRQGLWKNEGNIFNDWVDCIEIENLELKLNVNYCPPAVQN